MSDSLSSLPPELYSTILDHIPDTYQHQGTIYSLLLALPRASIPLHHLFKIVCIRHADQVLQLYRRLRRAPVEASWVKHFSLEVWKVDADIVVNLLKLLQNIRSVQLFVGANFAPEHMEEILDKPMSEVMAINLRFRPYVQRATYYQFHKGVYFDSTLTSLANWPPCIVPSISIVQDPLDPSVASTQTFAQPLVFFRLDPLTTLVRSPYLRALKSMRLRIPARQVARYICALPGSLPSVELLDLSTCKILDGEVEPLIARFTRLRHLILDGCSLLRGELRESDWAELGRVCASAGLRRAREREKKLKSWLETHAARLVPVTEGSDKVTADGDGAAGPAQGAQRRDRKGRRGLANATISLRAPSPTKPGSSSNPKPGAPKVVVPKIRILPSLPSIRSLSTTTSMVVPTEMHPVLKEEFEKGWKEGVRQINATRMRLHASWKNGMHVVQSERNAEVGAQLETEDGLEGLVDVTGALGDWDDCDGAPCPVFCLAGPEQGLDHVDGCGHQAAWEVWEDRL